MTRALDLVSIPVCLEPSRPRDEALRAVERQDAP